MGFEDLRVMMLVAATSCMTTDPQIREKVLDDIGCGALMTIVDNENNTVSMDINGEVDWYLNETSTINSVKENVTTIDLYFSYEFGGGVHVFVRDGPGLNFKEAPRKDTISKWTSPFPNDDNEAWEKEVIEKLKKIHPKFPYAWIDYDSDYGYQGVLLYISTVPQ